MGSKLILASQELKCGQGLSALTLCQNNCVSTTTNIKKHVKHFPVPANESWRIAFAIELIEVRSVLTTISNFYDLETQKIIDILCTNLALCLLHYSGVFIWVASFLPQHLTLLLYLKAVPMYGIKTMLLGQEVHPQCMHKKPNLLFNPKRGRPRKSPGT